MIELFTVVLVIGALAGIAVLRSRGMKDRGYTATMLSDLRNLATAQESYFNEAGTYTTDLETLNAARSTEVTLTIRSADVKGWSATAQHSASTLTCAVFHGSAAAEPPATEAGLAKCN